MKKRWQEKGIYEALQIFRVVMLSGARQCGKTTLAKHIVSKDYKYVTLDNPYMLEAAQFDPTNFVKHDKKNMIIDEIQRVPELILGIKIAVDNDNRKGQYLITGSANIYSLPTVKESLAGRISRVRLRPFTYGEIIGNPPKLLQRLKDKDFVDNKDCDKKSIIEIAMKGGFPEPLTLEPQKIKGWYKGYVETLIMKDLSDITNIKRQDKLQKLVEVVAAFSSKFMDKSHVASSLGISRSTLESYINWLENIYITDRLFPWYKTDYERVSKQSKLFMNDTGLMSAILDWKLSDLEYDIDKQGKLIETFVYNQIIAQIDLQPYDVSIYHYRDREKREIDFIIETDDEIIGIEVKSGATFDKSTFKHLKWFKNNLTKDKKFSGIIMYTGEHAMSLSDNMYLVPINNLWE
ncbi:MAG: ATP-binding protein [Heliobacteriaceae bacterium]|jgi:predicted AAA+ superfamily ATPase|nr:ATP-binding protein [Heliobacteriaceae bacterium]